MSSFKFKQQVSLTGSFYQNALGFIIDYRWTNIPAAHADRPYIEYLVAIDNLKIWVLETNVEAINE